MVWNKIKPHIVNFIRYNTSWSIQAMVFISVSAYILFTNLNYHLKAGACIWYAIARAFGATIKMPIMPSIIIPTSRVIFTSLRNSLVGQYLGLDRRLVDHKLFAYGAAVFGSIHMIAHGFYRPHDFFNRPNWTGFVMIGSIALPLAGVFVARRYSKFIQKYSYSTQIIRPHQVGAAVFMTAYAMHTADLRLVYYAIAMYGVYLVDRTLEFFLYTHYTRIDCAKRVPNTDYIMLTVVKPATFGKTQPGQYAMLSFPEIDAQLECLHPFTICDDDGTHLTFLIKIFGKWTESLADRIKNKQDCHNLRIIVIGPYGSTLNNFYDQSNLALIGTGIGVTMPMAFVNHTVRNRIKTSDITVHICQRTVNDFVPVITTLQNMTSDNNFVIHFYLTGQKCSSLAEFSNLDELNRIIFVSENDSFIVSRKRSVVLRVYMGRPKFEDIVESSNVIGICGTDEINSQVSSICRSKGKKCYKETC